MTDINFAQSPEARAKEAARLALQFLSRVDLKGGEVPAFVEVNNWLTFVADLVPNGAAEQGAQQVGKHDH